MYVSIVEMLSIVICLVILYILIKKNKVKKEIEKEWCITKNGFFKFNYKNIVESDKAKDILDKLVSKEKSLLFFDSKFFLKFRNYNKKELFKIAYQIDFIKNERNKNDIKSNITVSALIHGFDLPSKLLMLNEDSLTEFFIYATITRLETNLLNKIKNNEVELMLETSVDDFYTVLNQIQQMLNVLSNTAEISNLDFFNMQERLKSYSPRLFNKLKNEDQLKRLLTICFLILEVHIPKDYIYVDKNVVDYILKRGAFFNINELYKHLEYFKW